MKRASTSKSKNDFALFISRLISSYECNMMPIIRINEISIQSGIEKRRIYDLMNVLTAFSVVSKLGANNYKWEGMDQAQKVMKQCSENFALKTSKEVSGDIFILPESAGIGKLAYNFVSLFFFFGFKNLNIRDASILMASNEVRSKPILRRLYLVSFLLEHIGFIKHRKNIGDYELKANIRKITKNSYDKLNKEGFFTQYTIECQINRFDNSFLNTLFMERLTNFNINKYAMKRSEINIISFPSSLMHNCVDA